MFQKIWIVVCLLILIPPWVEAAAKKKTEFKGKKVVALARVLGAAIEMPDQSIHNFGADYQARLTTRLTQSERYLVVDDSPRRNALTENTDPHYVWPGGWVPSVRVRARIRRLSFVTGSRGDRMIYGFDENFRNSFNDGSGNSRNEFPLRVESAGPSWFGSEFDAQGVEPFDSRTGLDLGDGFELNLLFAYFRIKYARYRALLNLDLDLLSATGERIEEREVQVQGKGFFFDVAGGYENYSGGISVARRDAMDQALKAVLEASQGPIEKALETVPLMAKVDAVLENGDILLGTGPSAGVSVGLVYESVQTPVFAIEVKSSLESGSVGKLVRGERSAVRVGMVVRESETGGLKVKGMGLRSGDFPDAVESIDLQESVIPASDLRKLVPELSREEALLKSFVETLILPYRIWRYFQYDRTYLSAPDAWTLAARAYQRDFERGFTDEVWAKQIGLDQVGEMPEQGSAPVVALIDTGIDYNHPVLWTALWLNPSPSFGDRYGWDFISGDPHPYDDQNHGTELASLVLAVAPRVKLMPLKAFNPWGITNSAALYSAFVYGVDHGAQVILCGWKTEIRSQAIEAGIAYAKAHGVWVVTPAGKGYPANFSKVHENVVSVLGVNEANQPLENEGTDLPAKIASPATNLSVAMPRGGGGTLSGSAFGSALVAAAIARELGSDEVKEARHAWQKVQDAADSIPSLSQRVERGIRLRILP